MSALWEPITLGEHFLRGAEQYGDRIALSDGTQKVTYRQLAELAEADRKRLRQAGVRPHELVILQMSNGIPFVQMFLALMLEEVVPILMLPNHGVRHPEQGPLPVPLDRRRHPALRRYETGGLCGTGSGGKSPVS